MDFSFKDFTFANFGFEYYGILSLCLLVVLFMLFEYFPGRNYFYSLQSLKKFIDKHLIKHLIQGSESKKKSWLRIMLVSLVWMLLAIALANPRWDFEEVESFKPNVNLVILLDISKSMDVKDDKPSRIERAKQEIVDIIKKSEGVNIGLIGFANQAHIISPVTDDKNAITYLLPSISTDLVGVQGSNIEAGLRSADLLLKPLQGGINYIIVMSDGGFEYSGDLKNLRNTVKNGKLMTFGFGTEQGAPIPDEDGKFFKDEDDKTIVSTLEKQNLILISGLDGYIQSTYLDDDTEKVVGILSKQLTTVKQKARMFKIWHDRFYIPLLLAMIMILPFFRRGSIFPVIIIIFFAQNSFAIDINKNPLDEIEKPQVLDKSAIEELGESIFSNQNQQAKDLFEDRQYQEAQDKFSDAYNKGVAAFRMGEYDSAEKYFSQDKDTNIDSEYNLGNAQLLQGKIQESITTYESVLKKDPDNEDAKTNLEIAKKLLKNPKNQQQLQQNQEQKEQEKQDQQKQQQQQDKQSGKNKDPKEKDKGDKGDKDKKDKQDDKQNEASPDKKNEQQGEEKPEDKGDQSPENTAGQQKKELDIQAKSILSKISSDPAKLMKNRFKYEEKQGNEAGESETKVNPW